MADVRVAIEAAIKEAERELSEEVSNKIRELTLAKLERYGLKLTDDTNEETLDVLNDVIFTAEATSNPKGTILFALAKHDIQVLGVGGDVGEVEPVEEPKPRRRGKKLNIVHPDAPAVPADDSSDIEGSSPGTGDSSPETGTEEQS